MSTPRCQRTPRYVDISRSRRLRRVSSESCLSHTFMDLDSRGGTINRYGDISQTFSMQYENRYLPPNIDILINTIRCSNFPHYMSERERHRCVQFYVNKTVCSPSLSDITSARYAVWTVGTDPQKHKSAPMAWRTKQNFVRATMWSRSVQCVCLPRIYIWNNEPEHAKDASRKVEKTLQVNFEMYQVYILSIYLSIYLSIFFFCLISS